jgi:hypothetical protein
MHHATRFSDVFLNTAKVILLSHTVLTRWPHKLCGSNKNPDQGCGPGRGFCGDMLGGCVLSTSENSRGNVTSKWLAAESAVQRCGAKDYRADHYRRHCRRRRNAHKHESHQQRRPCEAQRYRGSDADDHEARNEANRRALTHDAIFSVDYFRLERPPPIGGSRPCDGGVSGCRYRTKPWPKVRLRPLGIA